MSDELVWLVSFVVDGEEDTGMGGVDGEEDAGIGRLLVGLYFLNNIGFGLLGTK